MGQCVANIGKSSSVSSVTNDDDIGTSICEETFDADIIISHSEWSQTYELGKFIAEGGEGKVHETIGKQSECNDITKVFQLQRRHYKKKLARIVREYHLFNELELVRYKQIAFGSNEYEIYITMERLDYTLYDALKLTSDNIYNFGGNYGNVDNKKLKKFIFDIARQLDKLHKRGFVHLDVNPKNIMYKARSNEWKIIDGGLIRNDGFSAKGPTGKIGYAAPEIHPSRRYCITTKADVWSLGMVILVIIGGGHNVFKPSKEDYETIGISDVAEYFRHYYFHKLNGDNVGEGMTFVMDYLLLLMKKYNVEEELMILLAQMLDFDPMNRPSMEDIVNHDCLADYNSS